jgi:hypothetical protein
MLRLRLRTLLFTCWLPFFCPVATYADGERQPLDGVWRLQLDRDDVGIQQRWFARPLPQRVALPGTLAAQGFGDDVTVDTKWTGGIVDRSWFTSPEYERYRQPGQIKVPFWLQPEKHYLGAAWYQRDIEIPAPWAGRAVVLTLERPHWETQVWVDDRTVGQPQNSLATPHEHDLGKLTPGKHQLTVRVDNRLVVDVGHDSHSVSDHTQGNWNGIVGRIELQARPAVWLDQQRIFTANQGTVRVELRLRSDSAAPLTGSLAVRVREKISGRVVGVAQKEFQIPETSAQLPTSDRGSADGAHCHEVTVKLESAPRLWSEFSPALYELESRVEVPQHGSIDSAAATFGFREIATQGTQFVLNGQKIFLRGTLECCIFPKTGHPPTDLATWKRILRAAQAHGLNNLRFHSWCPPEAAFAAADELGVYFHVECSSWANSSTSLGDGKPVDRWLYAEADAILKHYGNHPSFVLLLYGNEPGGRRHAAYLAKWLEHYKAQDPRRLYSGGAGWPQIAENQFHVTPDPRIQAWGGGLKSRINARPPETRTDYRAYISARHVPVVSHEIGQWCVYPNFDEIAKYTGYLKPRNFDIFRDVLEAHHLLDQARPFLLASGKLQTLCYKEDIESALRTPGMGGFQLLDLHDFPGQGTALVGALDPFWESKGYVTAEEYRRFCNSTVPLARLDKRVFRADEALEADLEVAQFGPAPIENAVAVWKLVARNGQAVAQGHLPAKTLPVDNGIVLGSVRIELDRLPAPACYKLVVGIEGTTFENDWAVWVYPPQVDTAVPPGVTVADGLDEQALAALSRGERLLLLVPPNRVKGDRLGKVALGFSSIFWNTAWTRRQPPHTLGILCDPQHPALARFPTESHSNWQWWYLVSRAGVLILDDLPATVRPTVQVIDDWFTARRLGLIVEGKVGPGKILICSIDLQQDLGQNLVARQMRHSLLAYMASDRFVPATDLTVEQIHGLLGPPADLQRLGARVVATSSAEANYEGINAIDGDPNTMWHTAWTGGPPGFPHEIEVALPREVTVRGFTALPRQDHNLHRSGWRESRTSARLWGPGSRRSRRPSSRPSRGRSGW